MITFKEYYYLTEMPHSNRINYDYELEFFKPTDENRVQKFEEFKQYIKKLMSGELVTSPSGRYTFIATDDQLINNMRNDFLRNDVLILMVMNYFGRLISDKIDPKPKPNDKRTHEEMNEYYNFIKGLFDTK